MPRRGGDEPTSDARRRDGTADETKLTTRSMDGAPLEQPPTPFEVAVAGLVLPDRFGIKGVIGRGGMGVVLEVHDKRLNRDVAVKLLPREACGDRKLRSRFMREARAAGALDHPGIVTVHDVDVDAGFIVMELIRGESLQERLKRETRLEPSEVRRIGVSLLGALSTAHAASIVHRDVKPANILIDHEGTVKLVDFGVASFGDSDLTSTGMRIGTPAYMAPEQLRGRAVDARADIYAVGATLFEAATGTKLHGADGAVEDAFAAMRGATKDEPLAQAIARAVSERPDHRFASAADFEGALLPPATPPTRRGARHTPALVAGGAAFLAAVAATVAWSERSKLLRASPSASVATDSARDAPGTMAPRSVALLPFVDETGDPQLDFTDSGLPYLLEQELAHIDGISVVGYYRLRERVPPHGATLDAWRAAARAMGADVVVRGELTAHGSSVHVAIYVEETSTGRTLSTLGLDAGTEQIPGVVRGFVADIATAAVGHRVTSPQGTARPFSLERELQLGIRAVESHDFPDAGQHLRAAISIDPSVAEAHYYLALVLWWEESDDARAEVALALRGELDDAQRGFMQGLELLIDRRFTQAIAHFEALEKRFPKNRDLVYGLVEASFHGGHADDAMAAYHRVVELSPRFRLGFFHVVDHYTAHDDDAGLDWTLQLSEIGTPGAALTDVEVRIARRDYKGAIDELQQLLERLHVDDPSQLAGPARLELARAYAVTGHTVLALGLLDRGADPVARLSLATALGDAREVRDARVQVISSLRAYHSDWQRGNVWLTLGAFDVASGDASLARDSLAGVTSSVAPDFAELRVSCGRGLLGGLLGDNELVAQARDSEFPEAAAIGSAFDAEARGDFAGAIEHWKHAASLSADGRFMVDEWLLAARAARRAGNRAATIAACEEAIEPHKFEWSWGAAVGPCLQWTIEAQVALGQAPDARATYKRLLSIRSRAPLDDQLLRTARAALPAE